MPIIRIEMFEGRTPDQKRACAEAVTKAWCDTCGGTPQMVTVVLPIWQGTTGPPPGGWPRTRRTSDGDPLRLHGHWAG